MESSIQFAKCVEYARARFGDSVIVRYSGDDLNGPGAGSASLLLSNSPEAAEIEIVAMGDYYVLFAGSLRFEPRQPGVAPILWALDLLMTFKMEQIVQRFVSRTIVGEPEFLERAHKRGHSVRETWSPWVGETRSREEVARAFGNPESFGDQKLESIEVLPRRNSTPRSRS